MNFETMKTYNIIRSDNYLAHHGIQGQKWGVRRYQNEDGTLTAEGRERYGVGSSINGGVSKASSSIKKAASSIKKAYKKAEKRYNAGKDIAKERNELADKEAQRLRGSFSNHLRYVGESMYERRYADPNGEHAATFDNIHKDVIRKSEEEGREIAEDEILKKYGAKASSDADFADMVNAGAAVVGGALLLGVANVIAATIYLNS